MEVAKTILAQLGGNKFVAMTGANTFTGRPDGLSFKVGRNASKITHVRVTLTAMDDYQIEGLSVRGTSVKPIAFRDGVYAENLRLVFERMTGLRTRL